MRWSRCSKCHELKPLHASCGCQAIPSQLRGTTGERGYDTWWQRYSVGYRAAHPYCVACLAVGLYTPACLVDHVIPFHRPDGTIDEVLRRDPSNHQSLCDHRYRDCHGRLKKPIEAKYAGQPQMVKRMWEQKLEELRVEKGNDIDV